MQALLKKLRQFLSGLFRNESNNITESMKPSAKKLNDFFSDNELRCKGVNCGCGNVVLLDPVFTEKLLNLRLSLNLPMKVNSCCRCKVHNERVGGAPKSWHISDKPAWAAVVGTGAIDVGYSDISYRNTLARIAYEQGWRIGLHPSFLHLDIAHMKGFTDLPRFFLYSGKVTQKQLDEFKKQVTGQ